VYYWTDSGKGVHENNNRLGGIAAGDSRRRPNLGVESCQTSGRGIAFHGHFDGDCRPAARAEPIGTAIVGEGTARRTLTAYAITGLTNTPIPIWMDDSGRFFGVIGSLSWIRSGFELRAAGGFAGKPAFID